MNTIANNMTMNTREARPKPKAMITTGISGATGITSSTPR
jgi:hypothetical protein